MKPEDLNSIAQVEDVIFNLKVALIAEIHELRGKGDNLLPYTVFVLTDS